MATYGQSFRWTTFGGAVTEFSMDNFTTIEEALHKTLLEAVALGWTPPRWWQFWRWHDYPRHITWQTVVEAIMVVYVDKRYDRVSEPILNQEQNDENR